MVTNCVGIELEKIRATVVLGGREVKTPFVQSFSVNKSRTRLPTTASVSVELQAGTTFIAGQDIEIRAGLKGKEELIFTGQVQTLIVTPSADKAGYFVINLQAADKMIELENCRFSRRLRSEGFSAFVSIEGGPRNRPNKGFSVDKRIRGGKHQYTSPTPSPSDSEHSKLTKMPKRNSGKHGNYNKTTDPTGSDTGAGQGIGVHDHSTLSKGGPAFGVYSAD